MDIKVVSLDNWTRALRPALEVDTFHTELAAFLQPLGIAELLLAVFFFLNQFSVLGKSVK